MLLAALFLLHLRQAGPTLAELDKFARVHDGVSLRAFVAADPPEGRRDIMLIKTGGSYGVGEKGWHAEELTAPDKSASFVVFTTQLTGEDIGDLVYQRMPDGMLRYLPEINALGVHVAHNDIDVSLNDARTKALFTDKADFKMVDRGPVYYILRISPVFKMSSVKDSAGKDVPFQQAGGVVILPRGKGGEWTYTLTYGGGADTHGYAGSVTPNEVQFANDYWYPMIARWPVAYKVTVHAPSTWTVVAQGDMVSQTGSGDDQTVIYDMHVPVTYYSLSMGPYKSVTSQVHGRDMTTWSMHLDEQQMRDQNQFYGDIIDFYSRNFSTYPFKGYGALSTDLYSGGALEAYSYATWQSDVLPSEDAHEPSHTWWGGIINNTYLESFWNESFADYSDDLFHREFEQGSVDERRLAYVPEMNGSRDYNAGPVLTGSVFTGPPAGTLGYGKGAQVLYMLEQEIGHDKMVASMRRWLKDSGLGTVGTWEGYEKAVQEVTGQDYKWFFDQWLTRTGIPQFSVNGVGWADGQVSGKVTFTGAPYRMHVEVLLGFADGSRRLESFETGDAPTTEFHVLSDKKPNLVSIDPYNRLLRNRAGDEYPVEIARSLRNFGVYRDPAHQDYLQCLSGQNAGKLSSDLKNVFLIGSPETLPAMKPLCDKVGFAVSGDSLTYKGTTIDLTKGGAMAIVDLDGGGQCMIGLGKVRILPGFGHTRLIVTDDIGRFIRGVTEPKTSGTLTFRL